MGAARGAEQVLAAWHGGLSAISESLAQEIGSVPHEHARKNISFMPPTASLHDVRVSEIIQGVAATVREGVFTYRLIVAAEVLFELGASDEPASMLDVFGRHAERIAEAASRTHREAQGKTVFISGLQDL